MHCIIMIMGWLRLTRLTVARSSMDATGSTVSYMESTIHLPITSQSNSIPTKEERFNTCCVIRFLVSQYSATLNKYP